ncbi:MAG: aspartate/glutamate racemase family protein [Gammaproteobacteria bacterium]|nr:aspartate/glutamate racemase family protein [Gammaproteobacteria bacterium]
MKTIGLLGGMSWESTQSYYRMINEGVKHALGGLHSAKIVLYSVDFAEIEALQMRGDWLAAGDLLAHAAQSVEKAGADFLLICTNTMHKVAPAITSVISIPILHIADATADVLQADGINTVGLLGTRFTMEQSFYKDRLVAKGIKVVTPDQLQRNAVHRIIYEELCLGQIKDQSRQEYLAIISHLRGEGAQAVILGCTEISLLVGQSDTATPLYDTTAIHAQQAVKAALTDL